MEYTNRQLLHEGQERLKAAGITEADADAWILFAGTTGLDRTAYLMRGSESVKEDTVEKYFEKIRRRMDREPVQYIEGTAPFMGYDFAVNENVLIPRMDTEILVSEALKEADRMCRERLHGTDVRVLDMCTGSGCIIESLYLLLEKNGYEIKAEASDVSEKALETAKLNAERLGAEIKFNKGNLFESVNGTFNMILSNPPYIRTSEIEKLQDEVKLHDPFSALDGKEDGLYFYKKIIADAKRFLKENGVLAFEIGYDQGKAVSDLMKEAGYDKVFVKKDLAGLDRIVCGVYY